MNASGPQAYSLPQTHTCLTPGALLCVALTFVPALSLRSGGGGGGGGGVT